MSKKRKQRLPYSHKFDALGDLKPSLLFPLSPSPPVPSSPSSPPPFTEVADQKIDVNWMMLCSVKEHGKIKCIL